MNLDEAKVEAQRIAEFFERYALVDKKTKRPWVAITGDLRREALADYDTVEVLVIPDPYQMSAMDRAKRTLGRVDDKGSRTGLEVLKPNCPGLKAIKIHWACRGQWGGKLLETTGPLVLIAEIRHYWQEKRGGDRFSDGYFWKAGEPIDCPQEREAFTLLLQLPYVDPRKRNETWQPLH